MQERNLRLQGMDTLKRIGNTIWGNAFELKKKIPGLKFNPQLVLVCNQPSNNSASCDIQTVNFEPVHFFWCHYGWYIVLTSTLHVDYLCEENLKSYGIKWLFQFFKVLPELARHHFAKHWPKSWVLDCLTGMFLKLYIA